MKRTLTIIICTLAVIAASAQPNSKLRPQETVLLYADSFEGNIDPVYGDKISYAGFKMKEANGLATYRDGQG